MNTNHARVESRVLRTVGNMQTLETRLKFHTPFTLEEADDLLRQAEAKRDGLDRQYAGMVEGVAWFIQDPLQEKRPFKTVQYYLTRLLQVQMDIQQLEHAIDEAIRGQETLASEKMWELAETLGLKYPQTEAQQD
jgi:hypothetical protein